MKTRKLGPVVLKSFTASVLNDPTVRLDWMTEPEIDNAGFEVWRAEIGKEYLLLDSYQTNNSNLQGNAPTNTYYYIDENVEINATYKYKLFDVDLSGISHETDSVTVSIEVPILLTEYSLFQSYPNPFNPSTTIIFTLPKSEQVLFQELVEFGTFHNLNRCCIASRNFCSTMGGKER